MRKRLTSLALAATALALAAPPAATAAEYVPGEVIVKYRGGTAAALRAEIRQQAETAIKENLPAGSQLLSIRDGGSVDETVAELRRDPDVLYAVPNYIARASALYPNDPGWRHQWNFHGVFGINMPDAWTLARRRLTPGGRGGVIAILDTGVAYRNWRHLRRVPDLNRFVAGYDFVSRDRYPDDGNGHGTHVSGTAAQTTDNRQGVAGIAYRARIMPLRVLNRHGEGTTSAITQALRFAANRRVDVVNMSLEFDRSVSGWQIPDVISALRYARDRGVSVVAAAGNSEDPVVAYPARGPGVIAVSSTTHRGCLSDFSNTGWDVDVAAPGGGFDTPLSDNEWDAAHCNPVGDRRWIFQQTYLSSRSRRFGLPRGYEGTSMSAPHVAGVIALIKASSRLGRRRPSPAAVEALLERTARDIGPPGFDQRYGHGLLDAEAVLR